MSEYDYCVVLIKKQPKENFTRQNEARLQKRSERTKLNKAMAAELLCEDLLCSQAWLF